MWTTVYNKWGKKVDGGFTTLREQLKKEHQPVVMVELLDISLEAVGDRIWTPGAVDQEGEISNLVTDGNIDVDVERGTRRTAEITILNPTGDFTPGTGDYKWDGPWDGKLYLNRIVRIWRGVRTGQMELFVPVGTFMIDNAEVIMEDNMSMVNLTLSDLWKKLTKSHYGYNKTYAKGTYYNAIIKDMLQSAGVKGEGTGRYGAVIDNLAQRGVNDKKLGKQLKFSRGDSRGDKLKELAADWNIDMYFDPMGKFRTEDRKSARDKREVWQFASGAQDIAGRNSGIISITRSFNDDNLYNHVVIIGTGNKKGIVRASRSDDWANSKFSISKIGDRVFLKESEKISTQNQANAALNRIWDKRIQMSESINADVICNPCLEADDVIRITEETLVKVDDKYRLRRFNVPLVTSKQTVEAANIIRDKGEF